MTQDEIREEMWRSMPGIRKFLLGRRRIDRMVDIAAMRAPAALLRHVAGRPDATDVVEAAWRGDVKKHYSLSHGDDVITFGPLFWIIASAVIQFIVQKLLEWWFTRTECRKAIESWSAT